MYLKSWNDKHKHSQDAAVGEKHPSIMGTIGKTNPVPFLGRLRRRAHQICMNSVLERAPSSPWAVFSLERRVLHTQAGFRRSGSDGLHLAAPWPQAFLGSFLGRQVSCWKRGTGLLCLCCSFPLEVYLFLGGFFAFL